MAVIAVLIGGIFGFSTFLSAWLLFDASVLNALAIYAASGAICSISLIFIGILTRRTRHLKITPVTAKKAKAVHDWNHDTFVERAEAAEFRQHAREDPPIAAPASSNRSLA